MSDIQTGVVAGSGPLWRVPTGVRRLLLVAPPLALAGFTVLHPNPDHSAQALMDAATWFMAFHMIQLGLVGLVAVSVFLLADQLRVAAAWPTCLGMGLFLVFFSAYDTLAGIGTGLAMRSARELPGSQQEAVFQIVESWPALAWWVFWLSLVGTMGWVVALGYLAVVARATGAPRAQWILLGLAAFFFLLGHPAPFGTLAFGSLFVAVLLREWRTRDETARTSLEAGAADTPGVPAPERSPAGTMHGEAGDGR
jgi:hypothetical protein